MGLSALMAAGLTSCVNEYDITQNFSEETNYADDFEKTFGGYPDHRQTWSMATLAKLSVHFGEYEQIDGALIKVYTRDPYDPDSELAAIAEVTGYDMQLTLEISKETDCVYVMVVYAEGYVQYKPIPVVDGQCAVSFGTQDQQAYGARGSANTNGTNDIDFWDGKVPAGQYVQVAPADAYVIKGSCHQIDSNGTGNAKNVVLDNADINNMNFYNPVNVYIKGHTTVNKWYCAANSNIYILEESALVLSGTYESGQYNTTWTVCRNGTIDITNAASFGYGQTVYNNGTILAPKLSIINNCVFYNDNTLKIDRDIVLTNAQANLINKGTIKADGGMFGQGGGHFYNDVSGNVDLKGTSLFDSNDCLWFNKGHYRTKHFTFNANSRYWRNDCYVRVYNKLDINLGGANTDGTLPINNSYVEADTLLMDNGGIYCGRNSQLIVNNIAQFGTNNYPDKGYGLISTATGSEFALFKSRRVVMKTTGQGGTISYIGNIYVDCSDHFSQGKSGNVDYYILQGEAALAPGGNGYSIPGDDCCEPYNFVKPTPPADTPVSWIMACEDLGGVYDYDFNDIIFSVSHIPGKQTAAIKPLAAGGTLASVIYYKDRPIRGKAQSSEIHYMLGAGGNSISGQYPMINTGKDHSEDYAGEPFNIILTNPNATIDEITRLITVHVIKENGNVASGDYRNARVIERPEAGEAPEIIIVPSTWIWPVERTCIKEAYPNFENWSKDATINDWAQVAINSNLVKPYVIK